MILLYLVGISFIYVGGIEGFNYQTASQVRNATDGEFPYVVSVRRSDNCHLCGGTIVSESWVLTINRLSKNWRELQVLFGIIDKYECKQAPQEFIKKVVGRLKGTFLSSLALLKISPAFDFNNNNNVNKVKLPKSGEIIPSKNALIAGWGVQRINNEIHQSDNLQVFQFNNDNANNYIDAGCKIFILDSTNRICYGDFGGPFVIEDTIYGVIKYVKNLVKDDPQKCCGVGRKNYITNIQFDLPWIIEKTTKNNNNM